MKKQQILQSGGFSYVILDNGTVEISRWFGIETRLEIPSTLDGKKVTRVGDNAFSCCYISLTAVTIPDSVSEIDANPFWSCDKLTSINVSPTHPYFATIDGVLYEKATKKLVCYPCAFTATEFTIPQGIAVIGNYAFSFCDRLTVVTIPDSVTSIGDYAFYYCRSLTAVTIPESVTSIGDYAFDSCSRLTTVTIPDSVSEMGANPFQYCKELTSINVSPTHPYFATIDGVLYEKATKKLVCYPYAFTATKFIIPQGIAVIGDYAFYYCEGLTAVTIPDSVTIIGDSAFYSCKSLTAVTIPDSVTIIGNSAFRSCSSLTSVTIPDSVTSIGDDAFYDCSSLTSVTIPKSVTFIGNDAFSVFDDENRNTIHNPILTLTVPHDSYAEAYCKGKGLRYIYPDTNDWLFN